MVTLRLAAIGSTFDGRDTLANWEYLFRCTVDHLPTGARLMFTRDVGHHTSGWFKNPDYERCLHLSVSYRDPETGECDQQRAAESDEWARLFFGYAVRLAWIEGPATAHGRNAGVRHYRVFCDEQWQPIKPRGEVYSTELTEIGWQSFSEQDRTIISPLTPG